MGHAEEAHSPKVQECKPYPRVPQCPQLVGEEQKEEPWEAFLEKLCTGTYEE